MGVCTKGRKNVTAEVLMATPCTNSVEREMMNGEYDDGDVYVQVPAHDDDDDDV